MTFRLHTNRQGYIHWKIDNMGDLDTEKKSPETQLQGYRIFLKCHSEGNDLKWIIVSLPQNSSLTPYFICEFQVQLLKVGMRPYDVYRYKDGIAMKIIYKNGYKFSCPKEDALKYATYRSLTVQDSILKLVTEFGSPYPPLSIEYCKEEIGCFDSWRLLNKPFLSDVEFRVGQGEEVEHFYAHKFILSFYSQVFQAEFSHDNDSTITTPSIREIPDVHPSAFMTILRFMYRKETVIDEDFIEQAIYAADKYHLPSFLSSLKFMINVSNVCFFYPMCKRCTFESFDLTKLCESYICRQTSNVVKTKGFLSMPQEIMEDFFKIPGKTIKEIDLFKAYVNWADRRCKEEGLEVNNENRKTFMTDYKLIKYTSMTEVEFKLGPSRMGLLTPEENEQVLSIIVPQNNIPSSGLRLMLR